MASVVAPGQAKRGKRHGSAEKHARREERHRVRRKPEKAYPGDDQLLLHCANLLLPRRSDAVMAALMVHVRRNGKPFDRDGNVAAGRQRCHRVSLPQTESPEPGAQCRRADPLAGRRVGSDTGRLLS